MAKSFKGYGAMWSSSNEEEDKQAHKKEEKHTPNNYQKDTENKSIKEAHDKIKTSAPDNSFNPETNETPVKRGRGRPKMDVQEKKQHFNLLLKPATIKALNRIAGQMQVERGERVTITGLITQLIDEFIAGQDHVIGGETAKGE